MAWKDISSSTYKLTYDDTYNGEMDKNSYLTLQYDDATLTPTSVKIRFKLNKSGSASHYFDSMYVLYNANSSSGRTLYKLKGYDSNWKNADWPYYSSSLTLTKAYNDSTFCVEDLWICNNGSGAASATAANFYSVYGEDGSRRSLVTRTGAKYISISSSKSVATNVGTGSVSIRDNGDNTFTLTGTQGAAGANNPVKSCDLTWGYDKKYSNTFTNESTKTLPSTTARSTKTVAVYAKCVTKGTYGNSTTAYAELPVKNYQPPTAPGKPTISYTKSRLTIKENWKINWAASEAANDNSALQKYRIRFWKKPKGGSSFTTIKFYKSDGTLLSSDLGSNYPEKRYYYDRSASVSMPLTMVPSAQDISPGDTIKIGIEAYSLNGKSTKLWSSPVSFSDEYLVQNAGVVQVTLDGKTWKEGIVNVYVNSAWREADLVNAYRDGKWVESE